jgi:hypothetical protein
MRVAGHLLEPPDELQKISLLRFASREDMEVIGHEAVRSQCKLEERACLPKMP